MPTDIASAPVVDITTTQVANAATAIASHDLSILNLFMSADLLVKGIMLGLVITSFWSWTVIFAKLIRMRRLYAQADQFEDAFWSGGSLDHLYERIEGRPSDPLTALFCAAMKEWRRSASKGISVASELRTTLQQRIERVMQVTIGREIEALEKHMGFLASVGSTATFVGLFGTVWGIMSSFQAIAASKNTSLAVVAPGIAEALFATALGLIAAIPAMIAYNKISGELARYGNRLDAFAAEFGSIISRQLEEGQP